jgi:hypothetical protein
MTELAYTSAKFIRVRHTGLALLYYIGQTLLLAYVVVYQIWWKGGYQKTSPFDGTVDVKVKGKGYLGNISACQGYSDWPNCGPYDANDVSLPPQQEGAVFIATSFQNTPNQKRDVCAGSEIYCTTNNDCTIGPVGAGSEQEYLNGECNSTTKTCNQVGWCPPENTKTSVKHILDETSNFTIFFRVDGSFGALGTPFSTGDELTYNYNLFYLSDMISYAQTGHPISIFPQQLQNETNSQHPLARPNMSAFDSVVETGTVIFLSATILSKDATVDNPKPCDLDKAKYDNSECYINLTFTRVDPSSNASRSHGYNFRYTNPWSLAEDGSRSLTKVFGTRVVFEVAGNGAQFDLMTLTVAIGSGIGILSVAKIVCDFVMQYLCGTYHPKFKKRKYEDIVETPDDHFESDYRSMKNNKDEMAEQGGMLGQTDQSELDDDDIVWEKVGCWKMCQVRMCC